MLEEPPHPEKPLPARSPGVKAVAPVRWWTLPVGRTDRFNARDSLAAVLLGVRELGTLVVHPS